MVWFWGELAKQLGVPTHGGNGKYPTIGCEGCEFSLGGSRNTNFNDSVPYQCRTDTLRSPHPQIISSVISPKIYISSEGGHMPLIYLLLGRGDRNDRAGKFSRGTINRHILKNLNEKFVSILFIPALVFNFALGAVVSDVPDPPPPLFFGKSELPQLKLPAIFERIARCESGGKQFNKGEIIMSRTFDVGKYQINQVHWGKAKSMGMDLWTEKGNTDFALYLYKNYGTAPWTPSKKCWDK